MLTLGFSRVGDGERAGSSQEVSVRFLSNLFTATVGALLLAVAFTAAGLGWLAPAAGSEASALIALALIALALIALGLTAVGLTALGLTTLGLTGLGLTAFGLTRLIAGRLELPGTPVRMRKPSPIDRPRARVHGAASRRGERAVRARSRR
jgi:hypothetical protein